MNAVVILGAGASAPFGLPTLRNIFKDNFARRYLQRNEWLFNHLNTIFWEPRGYTIEDSDESLTVEEMLTILRDIEKSTGDGPSEETQQFRKYLYILIQKALFDGKHTRGRHLNGLIEELRNRFDEVTWSSFNWDCIFEASFWYGTGDDNYSRVNPQLAVNLRNWRGHSTTDLYLKLHGGINWWMVNNELTYLNFSRELPTKWREYENNETGDDYPVILEPSYYKYSDEIYKLLQPQWTVFHEKLVEADYVFIVGYSLPDADSNARSVLVRAFQENTNSKWIVVDPSPAICSKFRRFFGRLRLNIFENDFVSFNNGLSDNLDLVINDGG